MVVPRPVPPKRRLMDIGLREGLEDVVQAIGGDADARVCNLEVQAVGLPLHSQRDLPVFGELDGVAQQFQQNLAQPVRVAMHELSHIGPDMAA